MPDRAGVEPHCKMIRPATLAARFHVGVQRRVRRIGAARLVSETALLVSDERFNIAVSLEHCLEMEIRHQMSACSVGKPDSTKLSFSHGQQIAPKRIVERSVAAGVHVRCSDE
jgi:hypothetical protein